MMQWKNWMVVGLVLSVMACDKKSSESPKTEEKPKAEETQKTESEAPEHKEEAKAEGEKEPAEVDPSAMEKDPAAALDGIELVDHGKKAPDGFEIKGEVLDTLGWKDKYGANAIVFAKTTKTSGEKTTALLTVTHALLEGDGSWSEVHTYKERVADCEFDIIMKVHTGDWSITDLDKNKLGEASFAWTADCTSDISPNTHKVLLVQDEKKYVLRGHTKVDTGGGHVLGGDFKPDPAFEKAPEEFLAHAKKVWEATSIEKL